MRPNNHQNKVGDKILVKHKIKSKYELEFMGPFPFGVMGNGPMNYNSCLDFFLRLTRIFHQPCIGGYSGAYFCVCYFD